MTDAVFAQSIDDRRNNGWRCPNNPTFTGSFGAKHVGRRGYGKIGEGLKGRQIIGARQGIIQQATGDELSRTWLIVALLQQRLANTLSAPAMNLPVYDHWIYDNSNVIDGDEALEIH